jgi:hypothetical protein
MYNVPIPAVMPIAKVVNATEMLLVVIALDATGCIPTIECVHISWRSMLSTILGPSTWREKSGFFNVTTAPASPQIKKRAVLMTR